MFKFLIILASMAASCFSYEVPSYTCKDLGTLGADSSYPLSINNKNQVLGYLSYNNQWYNFLWSEESGLQIPEIPLGGGLLNDNGQIAGVSPRSNDPRSTDLWIWGQNDGMMIIGSYDNASVLLKKFNNNGDLIFHVHPHPVGIAGLGDAQRNQKYYFWDNEKQTLTNLTDTFQSKFVEPCNYFLPVALNNRGEIAIVAKVGNEKNKSYLWIDNKIIQKSYGFDVNTDLLIQDIDDKGNVIVKADYKDFFVNECLSIKEEIQVFYGIELLIRNGHPILHGCTPSILKKDLRGICYYTPGADINKITVLDNIWKGGVSIKGQNDNGYAIGTAGTVFYQQTHAVLLVPESQ